MGFCGSYNLLRNVVVFGFQVRHISDNVNGLAQYDPRAVFTKGLSQV